MVGDGLRWIPGATAATGASDLRRWSSTWAILRRKVGWPHTVNYSRDETPIIKVHAADAFVRRPCPSDCGNADIAGAGEAMPPSLGFPALHCEFAGCR